MITGRQSVDEMMSEIKGRTSDGQQPAGTLNEMTIAEEQRALQNEAMINKRLEKALRKSFAGGNAYPTFAFYGYKKQDNILGAEKRPRLTLYGEVNEDELFATKTKKLEETLVYDE